MFRRILALVLIAFSGAVGWAGDIDPILYVNEAIARGEKCVVVPTGRYFVDLPTNRTVYLSLHGLRDVTIDFQGGELIGKVRSQMLRLSACTNVTIRNLTVDYETLPFTQAVIEKVDAEKNWDVRVIPGYPCPDDPDGNGCAEVWPVQAYDRETLELKNPMRYLDGIAVRRTGADTYRITGGTDRRGDVGDIAVWSIKDMTRPVEWAATWMTDCVTCALEDVTVYSTPMGVGFMDIAGTANTYLRCVLDRRPPAQDFVQRGLKRLRSGNHDAFNCRGSIRGFRVIDCTARYHCDDCINVSGWYCVVTEGAGNTYRVVGSAQALQIFPGDTVQVMTWEGRCLPDATVTAITPDKGTTKDEMDFLLRQRMWPGVPKTANMGRRVTFDRPIDLARGAIICSNNRTSNGFVVRGNRFGRARARGIIVQASDGIVEDNLIEAPFDLGIKISMSYIWLEASCGKNVMVRNNRIVRPGRGTAIWVGGTPGKKGGCLLADSHRNISFVSNRIENAAIGIDVLGCTDLTLRHNDIRPASGKMIDRVRLNNVADVHFREIRPARVFADHMVVPRDRPIPVWGRGTPGDRLQVRFRGTRAETVVASDGTWRVELPAQPASTEGARLSIVGGDDVMAFEDVLVGDVLMCSGQSNMEWPFGAHVLGEAETFAESAKYPCVRGDVGLSEGTIGLPPHAISASVPPPRPEVPLKQVGWLVAREGPDEHDDQWMIGCEVLDRDFAKFSAYRDYLPKLGIRSIRLQGGWAKCEKVKGQYDFAWLDEPVDFALAHGLNPVLETDYGNPLYKGGGGRDLAAGFPYGEEGLAAWDRWVDALSKHFAGRVRDWAMWNEPDIGNPADTTAVGGHHTPEAIAAFNVRTAKIIKRNIPDARLAGLSLATNDPKFNEDCYKAFGKDIGLFGRFIYHGYVPAPEESYDNVIALKALCAKYAPHATLWQGENGAPSEMPGDGLALNHIAWSEVTQAKWNIRRMLGDYFHGVPSSVFTICDYYHPGRGLGSYGLLRADTNRTVIAVKQAFLAVRNVVTVFDSDVKPVARRVSTADQTLWLRAFTRRGRPLFVFWTCGEFVNVGNDWTWKLRYQRPSDVTVTRPAVITCAGERMDHPVWVDLRTGAVYDFPESRVLSSAGGTTYVGVPVYDSPCLLTERGAIDFSILDKMK